MVATYGWLADVSPIRPTVANALSSAQENCIGVELIEVVTIADEERAGIRNRGIV